MFVIMAEALGRAFSIAQQDGRVEGIISASLPPVSFQKFVDETILSNISSIPHAKVIK